MTMQDKDREIIAALEAVSHSLIQIDYQIRQMDGFMRNYFTHYNRHSAYSHSNQIALINTHIQRIRELSATNREQIHRLTQEEVGR